MKILSMTNYRLHRYFRSSRPVIPFIATICFIRAMYSVAPMTVCSGFILSGVAQFVLMTFVALSLAGSEENVEEELLLFHGKSRVVYVVARELSLQVISCFYAVLFTFGPVITNSFNRFSFFTRALTYGDVFMGAMIILGSGLAGIAVGDAFHPRIMGDRKLGIAASVAIMILSIVKDALIEEHRFLAGFGMLLPSVMKPAKDLGNGDFFDLRAVISFFLIMGLYYLIVAIIKNYLLNRKKFS